MSFVQIIDCTTHRVEELNRLMDDWVVATQGKRTATHTIVGQDRSDPYHVVEIVEFPSYEEAMANSRLPETDLIYQDMVKLCDAPPRFTDLDVVRDDQLNKTAARRFFEELVNERRVDLFEELFHPEYTEHDALPSAAAGQTRTRDHAEARENAERHVRAFGPTMRVESQVAEGDLVTTRWTAVGSHRGAYEGLEPTGRPVNTSGHTTFRFDDSGRIVEGWWNWDQLGLLTQIGVLEP
ncbi:ester cyclase [Streptomyces sp. 4N509B]|uniref:ester cyclase n=1 Tax=Streptomyces sp. 4N509B TaxID=3457413 RepID=UPI003FD1A8BC